MHPAFLDNLSWEMAEVYGAITDQILINLARHFPFYQYVDDIPTSAFTYQAKMLAQMGQISKETIQIIRNGLSDADLALQGVLEQAIIDAVKSSQPELLEAVKKGVFTPNTMPVLSPNQTRAFQLYYEQAANKLNLVNTVMLESTQSAYTQAVSDVVSQIEIADRIGRTQQALDVAAGETITGVSSWNAALKHATDRMKEGGVCGFIDHAGRRWSAEAYTAMDIRTTVFNTGRAAVWETNQNFGNDLYIVSYHNGARPLCYPYQNMVISRDDRYGVTYDLDGNEIHFIAQSATSYGQPAGLFGINCKHYPTPFIPGVSVIEGHPQDPDANAKTYEESQKQRELERKLREEKRDLMMAKAQGADEDEINRLRGKCRETSEEIDEFCKSTGRARHRDREAVYTKREFPDADRYDVSEFEHEQKDMIDKFYRDGGEQQSFTAGQMTPDLQETPENGQGAKFAKENPQPISLPSNETESNIIEDFDIFSMLDDEDDGAPIVFENPEDNWQRSEKFGDFGLTNKSYPEELRYTEKEAQYVDDIYASIKDEKRGVDYSTDVYDALVPARRAEDTEFKSYRLEIARKRETERLEKAESMIAQRKAEGYHGRSKAESYARWQSLKEDLVGADEFEAAEMLESNRVGESGIRYWQQERKKAQKALEELEFAEKILKRERHAMQFLSEHK